MIRAGVTSGTKDKLVGEVNNGRRTVEGWIDVGSDYDSLHDSGEDRSNGGVSVEAVKQTFQISVYRNG